MKVFQSDGSIEFLNCQFKSLFTESGTRHCIPCPYTLKEKRRVERKHRHITETALSMLLNANTPASFRIDAFSFVVYIINKLSITILEDKCSLINQISMSFVPLSVEFFLI